MVAVPPGKCELRWDDQIEDISPELAVSLLVASGKWNETHPDTGSVDFNRADCDGYKQVFQSGQWRPGCEEHPIIIIDGKIMNGYHRAVAISELDRPVPVKVRRRSTQGGDL